MHAASMQPHALPAGSYKNSIYVGHAISHNAGPKLKGGVSRRALSGDESSGDSAYSEGSSEEVMFPQQALPLTAAAAAAETAEVVAQTSQTCEAAEASASAQQLRAVTLAEPLPAPEYNNASGDLSPPSLSTTASAEGWLLALSVVFAARLGRTTAQAARLDVRRVQRDRERGRALNADLRQKREVWRREEAARLAGEDLRRVEEVAARAKVDARRQAETQRKYREEAAREAARVAAERESARKEYEAQQAAMDAEYQERVMREQQLLEEARSRARAEDAARQAAEEERRRQEAAARLAREEEERREREEAARLAAVERKRVEKEKQRFAVRVEGSVAVQRPPPGTLMPGPLRKAAEVRLVVTVGSLVGGPGSPQTFDFCSAEEAIAGAAQAVGGPVRTACDAVSSALRLKAMAGDGPMATLEQPERDHWMAVTAARTAMAALGAARTVAAQFRGSSSPTDASFAVRTEIGVLPLGHPQRWEAVLGQAIALVEEGKEEAAVEAVLRTAMAAENEAFYKDLPDSTANAPRALGAALELAHFLDRMLYARPARSSDAPGWFEGGASLVRTQLKSLMSGAAPDSLEPIAAILAAVLGPGNPVAAEAVSLAVANVSPAEKARRAEADRARQALLAAQLLAEEWPSAEEIRAARLEEKDAKTPIAERVWALRNVAGTLAMGGLGERARARQLLELAVQLKQQFAGSPDHPAVLPELLALCGVLESDPAWGEDAAGVAALALRVVSNVAAGFSGAGDAASAALLMEAGLRRFEETAGVRSAAVRAATRRADQLVDALNSEEREAVRARRQDSVAIISKVTGALTEQLGAYKEGGARSKAQEWDERGAATVGPLLPL